MQRIGYHAGRYTLVAAALGLIFFLKWYYSQATSEGLGWILGPTAHLVEMMGVSRFIEEAGTGYVSVSGKYVIAPACAGVNFLLAAFAMLLFLGFLHLHKNRAFMLWLCFSLGAAYFLTLHVNAVRIAVSLYLYGADWYGGWFTAERVHRIWGILLYSTSLIFVYGWGEKTVAGSGLEKVRRAGGRFGAAPLFCYLLFAVAVPLVNQPANLKKSTVVEHYATVICFSVVVYTLFLLLRSCKQLCSAGPPANPLQCRSHETQNSHCRR